MLSCAATQHYIPSGSERLICTTGCLVKLMLNTCTRRAVMQLLDSADEDAHVLSPFSVRLCQRPVCGCEEIKCVVGRLAGCTVGQRCRGVSSQSSSTLMSVYSGIRPQHEIMGRPERVNMNVSCPPWFMPVSERTRACASRSASFLDSHNGI